MTLKEKVENYEKFLHKLSLYVTCMEHDGITELVKNADKWSYGYRQDFYDDKEQKRYLDWSFRTLCNTPETDSKIRKRQRAYSKAQKKVNHD